MTSSLTSPAPLNLSQTWIGAFFDVDNTLVPGSSIEIGFFRLLWRDGLVGWPEVRHSVAYLLHHVPPFSLSPLRRNKFYLTDLEVSLIETLAQEYVETAVFRRLSPRALGVLSRHQDAGHVVALVSGSPEFLVRPLADRLNVTLVYGARMETLQGRYTGRVFSPLPYGEGKQRHVERLASRFNLDLQRSYAYGDSPGDIQTLKVVGHPQVVNPIRGMARIARQQGWPVTQWA